MNDLDLAIARLQRAGISNAQASEVLYAAAWDLAATMWETSAPEHAVDAANQLAAILEERAERTQRGAAQLREGATKRKAEVEAWRHNTQEPKP